MPASDMSIRKMLAEAQVRWLKPPEVCDLIENYQKHHFSLSTSPPNKPPSGSLFLFDRKVQRYFRKDGHNWRKKRDNRTVREAHERLKSGSVDVLHCYYAHGEEDYKFQRRCYWMLDPTLEHIVLVHYRQVTEGGKFSTRPVDAPVDVAVPAGIACQLPSPSFSGEELIDADVDESADTESELSAVDVEPIDQPSLHQQLDSHGREVYVPVPKSGGSSGWATGPTARLERNFVPNGPRGSGYPFTAPSHVEHFLLSEGVADVEFAQDPLDMISWEKIIRNPAHVKKEVDCELQLETQLKPNIFFNDAERRSDLVNMHAANSPNMKPFEQEPMTGLEASLQKALAPRESEFVDSRWRSWPTGNRREQYKNVAEPYDLLLSQGTCTPLFSSTSISTRTASLRSEGIVPGNNSSSDVAFQQLGDIETPTKEQSYKRTDRADSFNRWMERTLCDDSLLTNPVHSGPEWPGTLADETIAQLSTDMMVDVGAVSPSLSQQKFNLLDFSPEWSFSSAETKVLVTGVFMDNSEDPSECKWGVMFGEVEVPASYLPTGVLSCVTPVMEGGRVPFYITCRDRQACSQVREFEFRDNPMPTTESIGAVLEDLRLQTRLARMLLGNQMRGSRSLDANTPLASKMQCLDIRDEEWVGVQSEIELPTPRPEKVKDLLCVLYLKQHLKDWLGAQVSQQDNSLRFLDSNGQGVLHLIAALGYSWGISPLLDAGYGINFRDSRGWTALHWAAAKGREDSVANLLASGAAPALKTDPTPKEPAGHTAADLALGNGYAGIAAYLAEAALESRLSAMTIGEKNVEEVAGMLKPLKAEPFTLEQAHPGSDDILLHESSVIAVKKATERAAAIQKWKRQQSMQRLRRLAGNQVGAEGADDIQSINEQIRAWKAAKVIQNAFRGHHRKQAQKQQSAAVLIQRRFRGYKGRKAFLNIRSKVVRIQANVRGHLVRKQYRKIIWSVGILEKAVLRWYRKRNGFRNFSVKHIDTEQDFLKPLKEQFQKDLWRDVDTIRNMMDNIPAEEAYNRLKSRLEQHEDGGRVRILHKAVSSVTNFKVEGQSCVDKRRGHCDGINSMEEPDNTVKLG